MPSIRDLTGMDVLTALDRLGMTLPPGIALPTWNSMHPGHNGCSKKHRRRYRAWIRDRGVCQLCALVVSYPQMTADRILPGALGGRYTVPNLWTACLECNQRKADSIVPRFAFAPRERLIELGLVSA